MDANMLMTLTVSFSSANKLTDKISQTRISGDLGECLQLIG